MAPLGRHRGGREEAPCELGKKARRFFGVEFSVGVCQSWLVYGVEFSWFLRICRRDPSVSEVPTIAGLSISHFNSVSFMQVEVLLLSEIMFTINMSLR